MCAWSSPERNLDRLLHDVALACRGFDRVLPLGLADGPSQHDSLAAIFVVRLQHERLPAPRDLLGELGPDPPGPWDVAADRRPLRRGVETLIPLIREQRQAHLLVQELGPKAVHHAHRAGHIGVTQRPRVASARQQLARENSPVDEVDRPVAGVEPAPPELERARVADQRPDPCLLEEGLEHLELGGGRQSLPVHDRNHRRGAPPPLPKGVQHRAQLAPSGRHEPPAELLAKRLHHRQLAEDVGEVVAVGHARGGFRVVFDKPHLVGEEAVEAHRGRGEPEAGICHRQLLFFALQAELASELVVHQERPLEAGQCAGHSFGCSHRLVVAPLGEQLRADRHAQRPLAEHQAPLPLSRGKGFGAVFRQPRVLEQGVKGGDRVFHASTGFGVCILLTCFHHRCSSRHGGVASPRA